VWERFSAIHPRLKESVKKQNWVALSLPVARRLLALLCQGVPQGEVEETITIDSEPFNVSIPLLREELVSVFLPLLGPDGELTGAIRRFLAEFTLSVDAIDRVVCMGWYGRLPLIRESLGEIFKRAVMFAEQLPTLGVTVNTSSNLVSEKRLFDLDELKKIVRQKSVAVNGDADKQYIIHAIQKVEGSSACCGVGSSATCGQSNCYWRDDCEQFDLNGFVNARVSVTIVRSDPERRQREKEEFELWQQEERDRIKLDVLANLEKERQEQLRLEKERWEWATIHDRG
jgi:hypothetical protein